MEREAAWEEVRRRRKPSAKEINEITTYFVSNVPEGTMKGEIRKVFKDSGRLTDVFMGLKIRKNGKHYAFVRFTGVQDVKELERKLDGSIVRGRRLEVNLAMYGRKDPPGTGKKMNHDNPIWKQRNNTTQQVPRYKEGFRDQRTFAEALGYNRQIKKDIPMATYPPPPPPTVMQRDQSILSWLRKISLIGEARSLTHLGHLPKLLLIEDDAYIEFKYIGGVTSGKIRLRCEFLNNIISLYKPKNSIQ
ncbi:unnamed protein product [Lactuca virosa]|uniref:RRM domain-containing protein n=1 Tax=Lactuca virosa TaxID=75947 RepID=A0AAU9M953_9ASTR|nr:unnamed protein product [Lactuca virosa]